MKYPAATGQSAGEGSLMGREPGWAEESLQPLEALDAAGARPGTEIGLRGSTWLRKVKEIAVPDEPMM